jgi:hypothetical protein
MSQKPYPFFFKNKLKEDLEIFQNEDGICKNIVYCCLFFKKELNLKIPFSSFCSNSVVCPSDLHFLASLWLPSHLFLG